MITTPLDLPELKNEALRQMRNKGHEPNYSGAVFEWQKFANNPNCMIPCRYCNCLVQINLETQCIHGQALTEICSGPGLSRYNLRLANKRKNEALQ